MGWSRVPGELSGTVKDSSEGGSKRLAHFALIARFCLRHVGDAPFTSLRIVSGTKGSSENVDDVVG